MARKRKKQEDHPGELNMVAMIDVAMQMLNFFLITASPQDVLTNLDVFRPSPEAKKEKLDTPPKMIRIQVFPDGFMINDKQVSLEDLDRLVGRLAAIDVNQTVLIMASSLSPHGKLIQALDLCAKNGMYNLSVISTN